MAHCILLARRVGRTCHHTLLSPLASRSTSPIYPLFPVRHFFNFFSQTFRRTLATHWQPPSNLLNFSTFLSSNAQSLYDPIDFSEFEANSNGNLELGSVELVEFVRKVKDCASKEEAIDVLGSYVIKPTASQVHLAIWALRNDWKLALLAFECCEKWGCVDEKVLGLIVWVLGSCEKFDIAWSLIRDSHRFVDTRQAMLAIIERYAAANNHEKAIKTFHLMEKLTVNLDQNAFYTVMSALCRYGNVEEAEEFMLKNKKLYPLEIEGFNIILHAWCRISVDVFEAKRVWREMAGNCVTPNAMSYTDMISCFSRTGNLFDSLRLYDEMKKRGWIPGLEVYNSLIYVMACEKCMTEARKVLEKMKEMALQPDSESYNCLICPLCEAGNFEEAKNLLELMTKEGIRPTLETYHAFLKGANLESTLEILTQMKKDKLGPVSCTFLLIFDRFIKLMQPENVLKVWVEMRNYGVHPESTLYMSVIHGLVNCGCLIKAKELHNEMISNGFVDDPKLKKLLQAPEKNSRGVRVGPVNIVRHGNQLKSPSISHMRFHRGRQKKRQ